MPLYAQKNQTTVTLQCKIGKFQNRNAESEQVKGAFSYLATDYNKRRLFMPINAETTGTPQQVRKVIDLVRKTIFQLCLVKVQFQRNLHSK